MKNDERWESLQWMSSIGDSRIRAELDLLKQVLKPNLDDDSNQESCDDNDRKREA